MKATSHAPGQGLWQVICQFQSKLNKGAIVKPVQIKQNNAVQRYVENPHQNSY